MKALGRHILVEFHDADSQILNDENKIGEFMNEAARRSGATIVKSYFHTFNPFGVSGVVIIAESHLAIHTWPEHNYASVDLFTCGDTVEPWVAFEYLQNVLKSHKYEAREIKRGVFDHDVKHKPQQGNPNLTSFEDSLNIVNFG